MNLLQIRFELLWTFKHVYSFVFMNRQILWLQKDYRPMWSCASTYLQNQKSMKEAEHKFVLHCHWKNNFCKSSAVQWLSRGREWWQVAFIKHCKWCEKTKELSDGVLLKSGVSFWSNSTLTSKYLPMIVVLQFDLARLKATTKGIYLLYSLDLSFLPWQ